MTIESIWYHDGQFQELLGEDPYGRDWHHCSYAVFNEEKLGLLPGTVKAWCEDHGYRVMQLYNDYGDSWEEFFEFMFRKGYIRIFVTGDKANIMFLSKCKRSVNACIDLLEEYSDKLRGLGVFYFILAPQDMYNEPFKSHDIIDSLTYLVNL